MTVQITVPQNMNDKQRALLREFARARGMNVTEPKSVLGKMKDALNKS